MLEIHLAINFCFIVSIHIENDQVYIKQLGPNTSFINQIPISTNDKQILNDGDKLDLLENEHGYTIGIEVSSAKTTLKRQNIDDEELLVKKQKVVMDKIEQEDDESAEENRLTWIQHQLNALQSSANQPSYVLE
jgi:hypothetical protein